MSQVLRITETRREIGEAGEFGRVAVLYGGKSASARCPSTRAGRCSAHCWRAASMRKAGIRPSIRCPISRAAGFDRVWIALHGPGGEDGAIQGALQWLDLPYTGSGVMASALAMDKVRSKRVFDAAGIPTPDYAVVRNRSHAVLAAEDFGYPLILKPACQGSSVGMSKVFDPEDLNAAVDLALSFDDVAIVERCIVGDEYTVAVLQGEALPSIRIETPRVFYDYRAKYESDRTRYHCPGTDERGARAAIRVSRARGVRRAGLLGLGTCRLHDRQRRPAAGSRGQHGAGHDQSQPGADGGENVRHRFRGAVLANSRDQLQRQRSARSRQRSGSWRVSRLDVASRSKPGNSGCRRFRSHAS